MPVDRDATVPGIGAGPCSHPGPTRTSSS
jgi:hypothetical protein